MNAWSSGRFLRNFGYTAQTPPGTPGCRTCGNASERPSRWGKGSTTIWCTRAGAVVSAHGGCRAYRAPDLPRHDPYTPAPAEQEADHILRDHK